MKKTFLIATLAITGMTAMGQKVDKAKSLLESKKIGDAKVEIDKVMADPKNEKNAEAYFIKAKILDAIADDSNLAAQTPDARVQSFEAIKKYVSLDEKVMLMTLENFQTVMNVYRGFFKTGATFYGEKKFNAAYGDFKNCLAVSDFMSEKGWTNVKLDTTVILYTGLCAERSEKKDDAAAYYTRLANAKVNEEDKKSIYIWLAQYYDDKKDPENTAKFLNLGKSLYPKDPYWEAMELILLRKKEDKAALLAKYEEMVTKNPTDTQTLFNYAVDAYVYGYNVDASKRPANSAQLIDKAEINLKKVIELNPNYATAHLVLGQINYNKGIDISSQIKAIRPPAGGKLKPEDVKKKDELKVSAAKKLDEAAVSFEKIDQLLGSKGKLPLEDKKLLKEAYDLLINIYQNKQKADKVKFYEEKYNTVEKAH